VNQRDVNRKESAKSWGCPQSGQGSKCSSWGSAWRRLTPERSAARRSADGVVMWALVWASCTQTGYCEFRCCRHWISLLLLPVCPISFGGEEASKALRIVPFYFLSFGLFGPCARE